MKKRVFRELQEIREKEFEKMLDKVNDAIVLENKIATGEVKVASIKLSGKPSIKKTTKKKEEK